MPKSSAIMQTATSLLVLYSFWAAMNGNDNALRLWIEAAEGPVALLGVGVGGKMVMQGVERWHERKYAVRSESPIRDEGAPE